VRMLHFAGINFNDFGILAGSVSCQPQRTRFGGLTRRRARTKVDRVMHMQDFARHLVIHDEGARGGNKLRIRGLQQRRLAHVQPH